MKRHLLNLLFLVTILSVAACGGPTVKVGSTVTSGKREALIPETHSLEPDSELHGTAKGFSEVEAMTAWPQAGCNPQHLMPNAAIGNALHEVWHEDIGAGSDSDYKLLARPVSAEGRIFTVDAKGTVVATNGKNGEKLWEYDTTPEDRDEPTISGGLGVDGDLLFVTTGFGEVIALKVSEGRVVWRRMLGNPLRAAPTIAGGRVYVVSIDNQLTALEETTGHVLWQHNGISESATLMGASNPAVDNDNVVVAYSSGEIYNMRPENGRVSWNYTLNTPTQVGALPGIADIRGLPVIDHGRIFAVSHGGRMASVDERNGERVWEAEVGGINTPIVTPSTIYVLSNEGRLVALLSDSGRIVWVHELQHYVDPKDHNSDPLYWSGPVPVNGKLLLVNSLGQLVLFSAQNGALQQTIELDDPIFVSPIVSDGVVYIVTDSGHLIALK